MSLIRKNQINNNTELVDIQDYYVNKDTDVVIVNNSGSNIYLPSINEVYNLKSIRIFSRGNLVNILGASGDTIDGQLSLQISGYTNLTLTNINYIEWAIEDTYGIRDNSGSVVWGGDNLSVSGTLDPNENVDIDLGLDITSVSAQVNILSEDLSLNKYLTFKATYKDIEAFDTVTDKIGDNIPTVIRADKISFSNIIYLKNNFTDKIIYKITYVPIGNNYTNSGNSFEIISQNLRSFNVIDTTFISGVI